MGGIIEKVLFTQGSEVKAGQALFKINSATFQANEHSSITNYPSVALPQISITAIYPGATPQTLNDSVIALIEDEITSLRAL